MELLHGGVYRHPTPQQFIMYTKPPFFKPRRCEIRLWKAMGLRQGGDVGVGEMFKRSTSNFGSLSSHNWLLTYSNARYCKYYWSDTRSKLASILLVQMSCLFGLNKRPCMQINGLWRISTLVRWHSYFDFRLPLEQSGICRRSQLNSIKATASAIFFLNS
jgi:hypothetical protein